MLRPLLATAVAAAACLTPLPASAATYVGPTACVEQNTYYYWPSLGPMPVSGQMGYAWQTSCSHASAGTDLGVRFYTNRTGSGGNITSYFGNCALALTGTAPSTVSLVVGGGVNIGTSTSAAAKVAVLVPNAVCNTATATGPAVVVRG